MALIIAALYVVVLSSTYYFASRKAEEFACVGLLSVIGIIAISCLVMFLMRNEMMGGLILAGPFVLIVIPIFIIGLGMSFGGAAKVLRLKHMTRLSVILMSASLILPAIGFGVVIKIEMDHRNSRKTDLLNYQSKTILDALGPHAVTLPISPQLMLGYKCSTSQLSQTNYRACRTGNYDQNYTLQHLSNRETFVPRLRYIDIRSSVEACRKGYRWTSGCIHQSLQGQWCNQRKEHTDRIWCTNTLSSGIRYETTTEASDYSVKRDTTNWVFETTLSDTLDVNGQGVAISCSALRDRRIITTQQNRSIFSLNRVPDRLCRIQYLISADIKVTVKFENSSPDTLRPQAQELYQYAESFWAEMTAPIEGEM